jgi:protein-S-isoprenylcysteine O-methyltransferase Ste14
MLLLLKNLLFVVTVPGTVAVYVPLLIARGRHPAGGVTLLLGAPLLAAGAAALGWCVWDFMTLGRGTPAPIDPPKRLVIRGLYRHTRNPMYVGVLTILAGWTVMYQSRSLLLYAVAVGVCLHLFVVLYEEPHLRRTFGEEYEAYRARVSRWL